MAHFPSEGIMRRKFLIFSLLLFLFTGLPISGSLEAFALGTPEVGSVFPDLTLPLPQRFEEREYLDVEDGPFRLSQIKSDIVIIEVFSMYCPFCQKEAPNVNALYKAIADKPALRSRIKLIGIGAGNSPFEVNAFRNLYRIEFALLPDGNLALHKTLGEVRTPYFFVLLKRPDGLREVIYSQVGSFGDPQAFLDMISSRTSSVKGKKK
jgi:thiol-disulfide isomerase/thioredoxin